MVQPGVQIFKKAALLSMGLLLCAAMEVEAEPLQDKPRLLILTDIGGDPDDIQSIRHLLVYADAFRLEGLVASASRNKKSHRPDVDGYLVNDSIIYKAVDDYAFVRDQLEKHAKGFPSASDLRRLVKAGDVHRKVGQDRSTPGSEHIIHVVDASDEVLNIAIWGGAHDLGQALFDVKARRSEKERSAFVSKLMVYAIGDQHTREPGEPGSGQWIMKNFPDIRYIDTGASDVMTRSFRGMYQNDAVGGGHPVVPLVRPGVEKLNDTQWIRENVSAWGPLGLGYPDDVRQNPKSERNTTGVKEGDTPSWFYFLPNGLSDPAHPEWGGWGGRFMHFARGIYRDAQDHHWSGTRDGATRVKWTVARWRQAYQNDFAARMRWCKSGVAEANHNPVAKVDSDASRSIVIRNAKAGSTVRLDAAGSADPDGDKLSYHWWIYEDVSSVPAIIENADRPKAELILPDAAGSGEVHVILEVRDNGSPQLTSYRRVVVKVG